MHTMPYWMIRCWVGPGIEVTRSEGRTWAIALYATTRGPVRKVVPNYKAQKETRNALHKIARIVMFTSTCGCIDGLGL